MEEIIDKYVELNFHSVRLNFNNKQIDYLIKVNADQESLSIEIEQKNTGDFWRNQFQKSYLEEITQKTGNLKKYPVFLKMLLSAMSQSSDSVFLDVLSYQDLEMLKSRKNQKKQPQNSTLSNNSQANNKRYMILTYVVEFDKVHYPLPLNYETNPDPQNLKLTVKRLRMEIEEMQGRGCIQGESSSSQMVQYKHENEVLRQKLKKMEEQQQNMNIQDKSHNNEELRELQYKCSVLERENVNLKNQNLDMKNQLSHIGQAEQQAAKQCNDTSEILKESYIKMDKMEYKLKQLANEVEENKKNEKKYQKRIQQLENELESYLAINSRNRSRSKNSMMNDSQVSKKSASLPRMQGTPKSTNRGRVMDKKSENKNQKSSRSNSRHQKSIGSDSESIINKRPSSRNYDQKNKKSGSKPKNQPTQSIYTKPSPQKKTIISSPYKNKQMQSPLNKKQKIPVKETSPGNSSSVISNTGRSKVVSSFKKNDTYQFKQSSVYDSADENSRIMQTLQELRMKNNEKDKENQELMSNYHSRQYQAASKQPNSNHLKQQQQQMSVQSYKTQEGHSEVEASIDMDNVDDRFNRLEELIKKAKERD